MKPIININEAELREFGNGRQFIAKLARLGPLIGLSKLGIMLHIVPAGKKAFPKHAHHANEELLYIIEGTGTYHQGDQSWPVRQGDVIAAPAGYAESAHQLVNTSAADLTYLCISTKLEPEVVEYPDSQKVAFFSGSPPEGGYLGARVAHICRLEHSLDYFEGES